MTIRRVVLAACTIATLSGCATIFSGSTQPVTLKSVPEGASVKVTDQTGANIHVGVTPVTLTLKRGSGYFKPASYTVSVEKDGFKPTQFVVSGTLNGWYLGNILIGGLIGMLAVDPVTGAMYKLAPEDASTVLEAADAKVSQADGALVIVLTQALSPAAMLRAELLASR